MTESPKKFREWDRHQWAGDNAEGVPDAAAKDALAAPSTETRWTKAEWVGEDASGRRPPRQTPDDMPEGEPGLSGFRHNPGAQHWATVEPANDNPGK